MVFPGMCLTGYWHLRNQSQADLKVEIRSRRPELKGELAKSTGRDQDIRTGRFSTEEKSE